MDALKSMSWLASRLVSSLRGQCLTICHKSVRRPSTDSVSGVSTSGFIYQTRDEEGRRRIPRLNAFPWSSFSGVFFIVYFSHLRGETAARLVIMRFLKARQLTRGKKGKGRHVIFLCNLWGKINLSYIIWKLKMEPLICNIVDCSVPTGCRVTDITSGGCLLTPAHQESMLKSGVLYLA